ncbi:MAG: hypothetical protein RSA15_05505 [Bacilli bacterium]
MINRFDRIDEFLIHIASIALSSANLEITPKLVYGELVTYGIEENSKINTIFKVWTENYKFRNNIQVFIADNYKYFCQFTNRLEEINKECIKLYIPQDKKHIQKSVIKIFDFLENNNIKHISKIAEDFRLDNIVIRVEELNDANQIATFINNDKYILEGLISPNPFAMNDTNIAYSVDGKASYNNEVSKYISGYINKLKKQNRLHLVSLDDFKIFVNHIYNNIFIKGKELDGYCKSRNIKSNYVNKLMSHMEVTELIILSLDKNKNLNDFVTHYNKVNNGEYKKNLYNFMVKNVNLYFNETEIITTLKQKEKLLEEAIIENTKKYGIDFTVKAIQYYIKTNDPKMFTKTNSIRSRIIDNLQGIDIVKIIKQGGETDIRKYVLNSISINYLSLSQEILEKASIETFKKYGKSQMKYALELAIKKGDYKGFSNKYREKLIKMINYKEIDNIMKTTLLNDNYPGSLVYVNYLNLYVQRLEKIIERGNINGNN